MLELGIKGHSELTVTHEVTAAALGSGTQEVLATPYMIAMMEGSALRSVRPYLEDGQDTVGTLVNVKHLSATPVGADVRAESELVELDRRRLTFAVRAWCGDELIGEGVHERFIIDVAKFMEKCNLKKP